MQSADLRAAWEEHAVGFIAGARKPGHDSYWNFHRDQFLELVPRPGRRTLDLGCGEGRLSRDLKALGHEVVAVDASPTMLAAARDADPDLETHLADAAALSFEDGGFDLVVAFMSLQDVDDLERAIREAARVLQPGGRFCIAVVHPAELGGSLPRRRRRQPVHDRRLVSRALVLRRRACPRRARDQLVSAHRPLQAYTDALSGAGLLIEPLREPAVPTDAISKPRSRRWQRIPLFLHLRALKPRAPGH
jgi:SAM-dependent methyltransferase